MFFIEKQLYLYTESSLVPPHSPHSTDKRSVFHHPAVELHFGKSAGYQSDPGWRVYLFNVFKSVGCKQADFLNLLTPGLPGQ